MFGKKKYSFDQVPEPVKGNYDEQNGATISTKEYKALLVFKTRVKDLLKPWHDDHYLLKWLKARNFDADKAEEMIRASMAYRKRMDVDNIMKNYEPPEVLRKYLPGGFCGYDKEGSPLLIELYGYTDMKGLLYSAKRSDIEKTKILLGERVNKMLEDQSKKLGRHVEGMTVILDMENVGTWMLWGPGIQMYAHMGRILQDNYPEIVKRTFIVNAPGIFPLLWKMFRPLVTEEMKKKVCILGSDFKNDLLEQIEADQLPEFLGGKLTDKDGDPRCSSKICQGGTVPEEYYLKELSGGEGLKKASVTSGQKLQLPFVVSKPNSVLRWEFMTDGYDIGFGVLHEDKDGGSCDILPVERVNSHMVPEDGTHTCTKEGKYIIIFDNSYSWARGKSISYRIDVVEPDEGTLSDLNAVSSGGHWRSVAAETIDTKL